MNTQSHRLIFNAARGCIMAVAETSSSDGKSCASGTTRSTRRQRTSSFRCAGLYASNQPLAPIEYAQEAPYFIANRSHWPGDIINSGTILGRDLVTLDAKNINNIGNNLTARAANVQAGAALSVAAGNNINIEAGVATQSDASGRTTEGSSFFASSKSTDRQSVSQTAAVGSSFGGNSVTLISKNDTRVQGSTVLADIDLTATAGGNVTITAATNTSTSSRFSGKTESGLSGSGYSVSLGSSEQSTDQKSTSTTAAASTVGSTGGNVRISAGQTFTQKGSDVLATSTTTGSGNVDITAKKVDIVEARETSATETKTEFKQSGITLSLSNPVVSAAQTMQKMAIAAENTKSDRMKVLAAASAAMAANSAAPEVGKVLSGKATSEDISLNLSIGASSSESKSTSNSNTARGSNVTAGGNTTIRATGDGTNSNLTVQGSTIQSGDTTTLAADNQVQLLAAANTSSQINDQKSSSASVGISLGQNTGITVSASQGSGDGNGQDLFYTNTRVQSGKVVNIQSGGDATLRGAVVKAETVNASVGGNLQIESLQDSNRYKESSQNASGSVTIGPSAGGSISVGATKINSDYQSVTEQSAIRAGDGGFNVNVQGNTDLKAGAITSTQKAIDDNKNSFQTAKLTTSDIQNSASYNAESYQVTVGSNGGSAGAGQDSGSASSTTKAAISGVAGNKQARTGDSETGINKIFDQTAVTKDINAQVQITNEFGQRASKAVGDYASQKYAEALKNNDKEGMDRWKEGGASRVALHALVGGLGGGVGGAAGAATSQATIPMIGEEIAKLELPVELKSALVQAAGIAIGVATGGTAGAVASQNATANNYLTAADLRNKGQKLKDCRSTGNVQCEINVLKEYDLKSAKNTASINYKSVLTESNLQAEKIALERLLTDPDISTAGQAEARRSIRELEVAINVIQKAPLLQDAAVVAGITLDVVTLGEFAAAKVLTSKLVMEIIAKRTGQTITPDAAAVIANNFYRDGAIVDFGSSRVITNPNEAIFWSGRTDGVGGMDAAKAIADQYKGRTLEQLIESRQITMPSYDPNVPASVQAWKDISSELAKNASGEVRAVLGSTLRPLNIWETYELPALLKNPAVTKVTTIDPKTGVEKIIFQRGSN